MKQYPLILKRIIAQANGRYNVVYDNRKINMLLSNQPPSEGTKKDRRAPFPGGLYALTLRLLLAQQGKY